MNTSYVTVEPKRRKSLSQTKGVGETTSTPRATSPIVSLPAHAPPSSTASLLPGVSQEVSDVLQVSAEGQRGRPPGRELRRARIVITVRRTESYTRWLQENPLQAIIASDGNVDEALEKAPGKHAKLK